MEKERGAMTSEKPTRKRTSKPKTMDDLAITYYKIDAPHTTFRKVVQWAKRNIILKQFDFSTREGAQEAIDFVNGPYEQLRIFPFTNISDEDYTYYTRLLRVYCKKQNEMSIEEFEKEALPFKILRHNLFEEKVAWTAGNMTNPAHGESGLLTGVEYERQLMYDFHFLLAETLVRNHFHENIQEFRKHWEQKLAQFVYRFYGSKKEIMVPEDDYIETVFTQTIQKEHPDETFIVARAKSLNSFISTFYMRDVTNHAMLSELLPLYLEGFKKVKSERVPQERKQTPKKMVYETNDNIQPSHLRLMKENAFLTDFDEVEVHNEMNIEVFYQAENDYRIFRKHIPLPPKQKGTTLRFKKLGNLNATGVYYSDTKDIIVDIRSMDALVHEIGHYIDNVWSTEGRLCNANAFQPLYDTYSKRVQANVGKLPVTHAMRKRWVGNSNYNRWYYLNKQEVFARVFEIFVWEVVPSISLGKDELDDVLFPADKEFRMQVIAYFEELFSTKESHSLRTVSNATSSRK